MIRTDLIPRLAQENGNEQDTFSQRGEDNRLSTNISSRTRIASGGFSGLHPDKTNTDSRT